MIFSDGSQSFICVLSSVKFEIDFERVLHNFSLSHEVFAQAPERFA